MPTRANIEVIMDILYVIGNNVIYVQVAILVALAIISLVILNPVQKTMIILAFLMCLAALLGQIVAITYDIIWDIYANVLNGFEDFIARGSYYFKRIAMDRAMFDGNGTFLVIIIFVIGMVIILYRTIKTDLKCEYITPKLVYDKETDNRSFEGERMMPNSQFEIVNALPSFQASVMVSLDGIKYYATGQCFWVDEGLVTAAHVIEGYPYLALKRDDDHVINVSPSIFEIGQGDYAVCRGPDVIVQKLGLSKAKFARLAIQKNAGISATITAYGKRTIGHLDQHPQFGFVKYTGSTIKGFSGAPYYFGRVVFGMHLGSDSSNIGYDGAFLRSELRPSRVIKKQLNLTTEDSAEWLIEQSERFQDLDYTRSPFDPDVYKVRVGGQYHIVDSEVMDRVLKGSKRKEVTSIDYLPETLFVDGVKAKPEVELSKESDPETAMVKGLLNEWGKTSIVRESKPVPVVAESKVKDQATSTDGLFQCESRDVNDLPLAPRDAMTFNDSGNLIRAPAVVAGAPGMVNPMVGVLNPSMQTYPQMVSQYQPPLVNYHMESRVLTHAPQNEVSTNTVRNKRKRLRRQQLRNEHRQYLQQYGPINNGAAIYQQQPILINGSTENSVKP